MDENTSRLIKTLKKTALEKCMQRIQKKKAVRRSPLLFHEMDIQTPGVTSFLKHHHGL